MLKLLEEIVRRTNANESLAVCMVAAAHGSTPQKVGATMLVLRDGQSLGTLGGGCVEAEVRKRALQLIEERRGALLRFQLDHDYGWDDGLVCGGTMTMAVQVVSNAKDAAAWHEARAALRAGEPATLRMSVPDDTGQAHHFAHDVLPTPHLVVAGAGHVGMALGQIAQKLEFDLTIIDDRPDYASAERFPGTDCIVGEIQNELARIAIHRHTYVVIVTRGHRHDATALAAVIRSPARYIGLIGSKRKILTILRQLADDGVPQELLSRVHAPIGLNIGAVTPAEIAVSIAAELVAVRRGKSAAPIAAMRIPQDNLAELIQRRPRDSSL
ncbi:MAG: XdhC family protein [Burkholderiales bacterium]|nr:XdhC family protein [Phycisphaerae bacterium]